MQLPFVNMILVGGEDSQWNDGEKELFSTSFRDGTRLGNQRIDMRRIIQTETD
jgi:prephenate dehydrogenase